jgi:hypothetical protein
VIKEVHGLD